MSHPTWVRGLKPDKRLLNIKLGKSHPTWVRGLKHLTCQTYSQEFLVAPYVGAWIETLYNSISVIFYLVAPYVGAWIETETL